MDETGWTYRCEFKTPTVQPGNRVVLVFDGLDTFATVFLNGNVILETNNMFIPYRIDVTTKVSASAPNKLVIDFESAKARGRAIRDADTSHRYLCSLGSSERLAVRKAQYHWGWDWGPAAVTAGPWRPVRIETYRSRVEDIFVQYTLNEDLQHCRATISSLVDGYPGDRVKFILRDPDGAQIFETTCNVDTRYRAEAVLVLHTPLLWHPHGYGEQHRYELDADLIVGGLVVQHVVKKIAFRRAEVIQSPDNYGTSFYFRINGVDVFASGSCWIPADSFIPRLCRDDYVNWLKLMIEGNQIMTRYDQHSACPFRG